MPPSRFPSPPPPSPPLYPSHVPPGGGYRYPCDLGRGNKSNRRFSTRAGILGRALHSPCFHSWISGLQVAARLLHNSLSTEVGRKNPSQLGTGATWTDTLVVVVSSRLWQKKGGGGGGREETHGKVNINARGLAAPRRRALCFAKTRSCSVIRSASVTTNRCRTVRWRRGGRDFNRKSRQIRSKISRECSRNGYFF